MVIIPINFLKSSWCVYIHFTTSDQNRILIFSPLFNKTYNYLNKHVHINNSRMGKNKGKPASTETKFRARGKHTLYLKKKIKENITIK